MANAQDQWLQTLGVPPDKFPDAIVMPQDEIKGKVPNSVRPPGGTIKAGTKPNDGTQKATAGSAAGGLTGSAAPPKAAAPPKPAPNSATAGSAAGSPAGSAIPPKAPAPAPNSAKMQVPLSKAVTLKSPTVSAGYVDITFKVSLEVTAKLDLTGGSSQPPGDSTQTTITPLSYDSGALAESIAQSWMNKDGVRILGLNTAFTEVKLKGAMKVDKGFQVTVSGTGKLACGVELELEITLVKIENNWKSSGPKAAVKAKIPWFPFSVEPIKGVKISDVQMRPTVAFEFQPNYKKIAADVTEELGTDVAGEQVAAKAMRAAATAITFDAAVVGGILLAGVGTIGAAILTIAEGDEIAETAGETNALAQKLTDGFRIGAAGGSAPGDKAMMVGYTLGMENYNTANETIKSKNPDADPEAIKKAIADQVPAAVAKASPAIRTLAQDAVWDKYGSGHQDTWYHSYERDRWEAWSNIYGNDPRGDRRYVKYMNEHSDRKLGM